MTDDTRKLIEEARGNTNGYSESELRWLSRRLAEALEASLPTVPEGIMDDPKALDDLLYGAGVGTQYRPEDQANWIGEIVRSILAAGFRRSPVPPETDDQAARDEAEKRWPDATIHSGREWRKQAFLEGAEWQKSRAAVPPETDDATRVLAQHAYDGLTSLDLSGKTTREGTAWGTILREAIDDLAAILAAVPPVTEEPEWEYGTRHLGQERVYFESYARKRADELGEHLIRRRKAGPWVPIPEGDKR